MKQLNISVMAINVQRSWKMKTSVDKAAITFDEGWKQMCSFAAAASAVVIQCQYLWSLRIDALAFNSNNRQPAPTHFR